MSTLPRSYAHAIAISILAAWPAIAQMETSQTGLLGVSLAGAEFGVEGNSFSNENPGSSGSEYTLNSPRTVRYFSQQGIRLVRLPFRWERIQPVLGHRLNAKHLREIRNFCGHARAAGVGIVLDVHNYARYRCVIDGRPQTCIIDEKVAGRTPVGRQDFANLWRRLAMAFRNESAVVGYGIMNEPHDMGDSSWLQISQVAVNAIRQVDRKTTIVVAGNDWSSAERFRDANGDRAWIQDPQQNTVYEAHCYFDADSSGKYRLSFAAELKQDPELATRCFRRVQPFIEWCKDNNVHGMIGEFGVPRDPAWRASTQLFLAECMKHNIACFYWAGGEWWGKYQLSIQPEDDFQKSAAQLRWLQEVLND